MECKLCKKEMESWESNNPEPLMENIDENRVCRDCNNFVTATRMSFALSRIHPEDANVICHTLQSILSLAFSLKNATEQMNMRIQPTTDFAKEEEE